MSVRLDTRLTLLSALVALTVMVGALLTFAPRASAVLTDCPAGDICLWAGKFFGGQRAFFAGSETGCHSLANIDPLSMRNHTGNHTALFFPGPVGIGPSAEFNFSPAYKGSMCID